MKGEIRMTIYTIKANPNRQIHYDDLVQAISYFYRKTTDLSYEFIEFYEDNKLLFTWVRGKGIIEKVRRCGVASGNAAVT
jgi:hypothetical protein